MDLFDEIWTSITEGTPRLLGAVLILLAGWLAARVLSKAVFVLMVRTSLDDWASERLGVKTGGRYGHRIERIVARIVFYAILVVVAVLVLNILNLADINRPLLNMLDDVVLALPRVLLAFVVVLLAFVIGKLLGFSLTKGLQAVKLDERVSRFGGVVTREGRVAATLGAVAFWFVLAVGVVQGLAALELEIVVGPLQGALDELAGMLPNLVGAVLLLVLGGLLIRFVAGLVTRLLTRVGFDTFIAKVGLVRLSAETDGGESVTAPPDSGETGDSAGREEVAEALDDGWTDDDTAAPEAGDNAETTAEPSLRPARTPSEVGGMVVAVVLGLLIVSQVFSILQLYRLSSLLDMLIDYLPDVGVAFVIVGAGVWAGKWVKERVEELYVGREEGLQRFLGAAARVAVLVFAAAIALQQLGVASELITTAFAVLFGAICLAFALAFGLGGRAVADDIVRKEYDKYTDPKRRATTRTKK